jgi:PhnB protein
MAVNPVPEGYSSLTPYLLVKGVAQLIEFIEKAFGATVLERMEMPDGTVAHAEARIGDTRVMMGEASDRWPATPGGFYYYVEDCDETYRRALAAGATSLREPTTEFYGDRSSGVQDASGVQWWISTRVENLSPEELEQRSKEWAEKRAEGQSA